jgi:hypothetical protein
MLATHETMNLMYRRNYKLTRLLVSIHRIEFVTVNAKAFAAVSIGIGIRILLVGGQLGWLKRLAQLGPLGRLG